MPGWAAFLRGVNLGAQRKASSAQLRSLFEELGFDGVATFRTSGNIVFESPREPRTKLIERIESALAAELAFEVDVFLRTAAQVRALAEHEPFDRRLVDASEGKLQVALLPRKPTAAKQKEVLAFASDADRLAFGPGEMYWLPSGGTRDSALNLRAIERLLGPWTMRTKGTIEELASKFFA